MIDPDQAVAEALRRALPPLGEAAPVRELWPEVARRISAPRAQAPPRDWLLAAVSALWSCLFPQGIAALLYVL